MHPSLKAPLKRLRWQMRRAQASRRWGTEVLRRSPRIFGNAMPKSGSHLLTQVLKSLTEIAPVVNPGFPPVNRDEANRPVPPAKMLAELQSMRPGDLRYGYIHAQEPYLPLLTAPGWATVFIYRDPRDMLISHVFYAAEIYEDHGMRRYYQQLDGMEERLRAAIEGVRDPEFQLSSVRERYDAYLGWFDHPEILPLRFEDLILDRSAALNRLLDFLESRGLRLAVSRSRAVAALEAGIAPRKSGTFRKGQPGEWREHFSETNKARFKAVAGDLLVRLGYETSDDW